MAGNVLWVTSLDIPAPTPRQIPLHTIHAAAGAKTADFGGWQMPIEYSGTVAEHRAVREAVGVFDVSHMGTARISGAGALEALNDVLTNDLRRIGPGRAQYTMLCNDQGGVIDDLIAYVVSSDEVLIVPNASNSDAVLEVLRDCVPHLSVEDHRPARVMLAVQGPDSAAVVRSLGLPDGLEYMSFARVADHTWCAPGAPFADVVICRTGYTGEWGYEILIPVSSAATAWEAVTAAGATPCGLGARDTLRLEMGYALHGHELAHDISPVQARLGWAVGWDKPTFHGRAALVSEKTVGPARILRGLLAQERGIPRADMNVIRAGEVVGRTTSGTFSPTLQQGIALALLDPDVPEGEQVSVDVRGRVLSCVVVRPPFVDVATR
jgi:aminomethyltransferase